MGHVTTNGIDSFWSMLKRWNYGKYHYIIPKPPAQFVNEFMGRQYVRNLDSIEQIVIMAKKYDRSNLSYKNLISE